MKGVLQAVVIAALVLEASAQGGGAQAHSLGLLGTMSNSTLVDSSRCTTNHTPTDLFCNFTNSSELIVNRDTGVALREVKFQICLCDSAMTVEYTLTNDIVIPRACNQCPVRVPIDRLLLENDFTVYEGDSNITRIAVLVKLSANDPGNPVTVFNHTVSLNQQRMDCNGTISPPPSSCDSPTTMHTVTPQPTTPEPRPTMKTGTKTESWKIYVPIICLLVVPIIVVVVIGILVCLYIKRKGSGSHSLADQSGSDERRKLNNSGAV